MKKIAVLGSTGSIGTQTLDIVRNNANKLQICSLVAYSNAQKLQQQVDEFRPAYSALIAVDGANCLIEAVKYADIAVVATRGIVAIECILYCLQNGIDVALANKEALVCAGSLIMPLANKKARLLPVDSEHHAISQCLLGRNPSDIKKIVLTASGGPFYDSDLDLHNVTAQDALKHPNWSMGSKITIDSATMMNKALEVVEASWLFGVGTDKIDIAVHRQSIIHSMVQFNSGNVMAQMAVPDMRLPIAVALLGDSCCYAVPSVDFSRLLTLTMQPCNYDKFPCAKLGHIVLGYPDLCATAMNAANDVCVDNFVNGKLSFDMFCNIIQRTIDNFESCAANLTTSVENIALMHKRATEYAQQLIDGEIC